MVKTLFFCFLFDKYICCQIGKVKKLFKDNIGCLAGVVVTRSPLTAATRVQSVTMLWMILLLFMIKINESKIRQNLKRVFQEVCTVY